MNRATIKGFSLLEAIVAMAIVASFGMAIFAWINTNLNTLNKIKDKSDKDQIIRTVVEYVQDIDIMQQPEGKGNIGQYLVLWKANPIEPVMDGVNRVGGKSDFEMGLYLTDVEVQFEDKHVASFSVRLVGHKKVRDNMMDGI